MKLEADYAAQIKKLKDDHAKELVEKVAAGKKEVEDKFLAEERRKAAAEAARRKAIQDEIDKKLAAEKAEREALEAENKKVIEKATKKMDDKEENEYKKIMDSVAPAH